MIQGLPLNPGMAVPEAILYIGIGIGLAGAGVGLAIRLVAAAKPDAKKTAEHSTSSSSAETNGTLLRIYQKLDSNKGEIVDEIRREVEGAVDKLADVLTLGLSKIEAAARGRRGKTT